MVEKSGLGSTIGSRSASPKWNAKNFLEMNKKNIKALTKKAGSEKGDHKGHREHGLHDKDDLSLNSHFSVPVEGPGVDFRKGAGAAAGLGHTPIKVRLDDRVFAGQGGTLPTPASGHGVKQREGVSSARFDGPPEASSSGRGLGRSQSPVDPRLKQVVSSVMAEVNRSIEAHRIQAERREARRQQK